MLSEYTPVIRQEGSWWIGWIEEVPGANAQERTREVMLASLEIVLREALEFERLENRE